MPSSQREKTLMNKRITKERLENRLVYPRNDCKFFLFLRKHLKYPLEGIQINVNFSLKILLTRLYLFYASVLNWFELLPNKAILSTVYSRMKLCFQKY